MPLSLPAILVMNARPFFFNKQRAQEEATFLVSIEMKGEVRRAKGEVLPTSKITPLPVVDWKEQYLAQYRPDLLPVEEEKRRRLISLPIKKP